jgi:DNA polymerase III delta subunit
MLHLIYGADEYGTAGAVAVLQAASHGDLAAQTGSRFDGASVAWPVLREACASLSLFAERQVVVVRGLLASWAGKGDGPLSKQATPRPTPAEFARFAIELPSTTELVLQEGDLSATNRYLKELVAISPGSAQIQVFAMPKDASDREAWVARRLGEIVESQGGSIDGRAARALAQRCGADLVAASNEVAKLLSYTAPLNSIFVQDVETLVADSTETRAYDLVDAVAAKDSRRTVDLGDRLLAEGQAPEQVLALVGSRIHDLALLAAARRERVASEVLSARTGWQPWRIRQLERSLGTYAYDDLVSAQRILVAADLALKSRPSHERPLVALLTLLALARRSSPDELCAAFAYN